MKRPQVANDPALPPLGSLFKLARFTEILPIDRRVPAPPRFCFGAMQADVAAHYFGGVRLLPVGLCRAENITLGDGLLMRADGQLLSALELNIQMAHVRDAIAKFGLPDPAAPSRRLAGPHALIVGPGYHIYGHWLAEILPKLGVLQAAGVDLERVKLLVPADAPRFAFDMLHLLGFDDDQFVTFGGQAGDVLVEELLLSSFLHNSVRYSEILVNSVGLWRQRVEARHGRLAEGGYPKRIFVARRGGSRAFAERATVEAAFADAGFSIVSPERLPLLEQWRMFADAEEIAGEYGSGLHGSLFSKAGTVVCGLHGSAFHPAFIQSGIGEVLGQPTGYIFGTNDDDIDYAFGVRIQDVKACLNSVFDVGVRAVTGMRAAPVATAPLTAADFLAAHDRQAEEGSWDAAQRSIRQAVDLDPSYPGAFARRARVLARSDAPGALPAINRAIVNGETDAANYALKAELLLRAGRGADAVAAAQAAVDGEPQNGERHNLLAQAQLSCGAWLDASRAARRAMALAPGEPRFKLTLHAAISELGQHDEAESLLRAVYAAAPLLPGAAAAMARMLLRQERKPDALAVVLRALAEDPTQAELRVLLSALLPPVAPEGATAEPAPDKSVPVARQNFTIDFGAGGSSAAHRVSGWSAQEPKLVWAIGDTSVLLLPALDATRDWRAVLDISAWIMPPKIKSQSLRVEVNGVQLASRDVERACNMAVLIPKDLLRPRQNVRMRFLHTDCVRPKDVGANKDDRLMAICFRSISLAPVNNRN